MESSIIWKLENTGLGTSLAVQWLRLHAPNAGGPGSMPGRGTRAHMAQLKILHNNVQTEDFPGGPVAKTPCSQCRGPGFDPWLGN